MNINFKKENQELYMRLIFVKAQGVTTKPIDMFEISDQLGLDQFNTNNIIQYLLEIGLLKYTGSGECVVMTPAGVDYVKSLSLDEEPV